MMSRTVSGSSRRSFVVGEADALPLQEHRVVGLGRDGDGGEAALLQQGPEDASVLVLVGAVPGDLRGQRASLGGTSAAIRPFSQPPWASPLAAMEQKSRKESSWSRISWNRLWADSMADTSAAPPGFPRGRDSAPRDSAKTESSGGRGRAATGVRHRLTRTEDHRGTRRAGGGGRGGNGRSPVRRGSREAWERGPVGLAGRGAARVREGGPRRSWKKSRGVPEGTAARVWEGAAEGVEEQPRRSAKREPRGPVETGTSQAGVGRNPRAAEGQPRRPA